MVIETFLNIFLCYSSLQCNRIPYFSPKHYIESTLVGNNRQYAFKRCNDTAILPKVYLNDVCRCVPEKFYSNFMFIKDGIRRGQFNGFKMNCTQVFNSTAEMSGGTVPQTAAPSRISTALADLLRRRGVSPLEIARIQATGLSEAELEQLQARRKLTLTEAAYMRSRGVPIQQINAFQIRGLLPSEIRALRVSGRLPPALPSRPFRRVLSSPVSGNLPQVTPIRPVRGVIANRIGRPLLPPAIPGRLPVVTPIRPVTMRSVPNVPPTANRRITKFQELQLLSRQANPLQLIQSVRSLNIADLLSVSREMTADQFVAMWKILTDAQKQQLRPQLTAQMRDRLTSTQTSQESLQAFQNLLTPRQMMQLSPEQLRRLGAVLAAMDGDKSQLPDGLLPTSNGDKTTETGLPFRQPDTTAVIGTSPGSTGITVVGSDSSNAAEIGTIDITGDNSIGGEGSAPATGTGMLTPVNKDSGAEKMILYDVVATEPGDSQLNKGNIVEVGISPIDTSGNVVDTGNQNVPDPPSPDLQLTSGSLVIDNTVVNAPPPSSGGAITGTSGSSSTNTVTTIETENTVIKSTSTNTQSQTDVIIPNYNIIQDTEDLQQDICKVCEARDRTVACYLEHPKMCNKFIQCVTDYGEKLRPQVMKCYPFMFWNPTFNSCVRNSTHCKTSTGLEDLPREPTVEAPVVYDNNPAEVVIETTPQPSTEATTESPPDYAPFERVHATVEMSLLPAPPSESGLTFPDAAPSGLDFPDIHTGLQP
ncbi:uncharacterized protein LOC132563805 [Ylistrum balloti]|uniref:uncharacterized protein LOC132563805 n=1 Tax=Ylistrum balloti TaxID=509963 RepID=UPI002905E6F1|nr:uncharacterized protein LOC132563805 [Ylistrum balloti]